MNCDCVTQMDAQLKAHGLYLETAWLLKDGAMFLTLPLKTLRLDNPLSKKKTKVVCASFCPFCGKSITLKASEDKAPAHAEAAEATVEGGAL